MEFYNGYTNEVMSEAEVKSLKIAKMVVKNDSVSRIDGKLVVDSMNVYTWNDGQMDTLDVTPRVCYVPPSNAQTTIVKKHNNNHGTSVTVPNVPNVPNTPNTPNTPNNPKTPDTGKHKNACNNGEGNGSEGCSPANSTHANNDENNSTPKADKSNKNS